MITGYPCSGKTTRALQLHDYFINRIGASQAAQKTGLSNPPTPQPHEPNAPGDKPKQPDIKTAAQLARICRLKVHLINIDTLGVSREAYRDARSEKEARATEYSAVKRFLSADDIVISDSLNYIKGYRYQLYCEAKAVLTPKVHIGTPADLCRKWNVERRERNQEAEANDLYVHAVEGQSPALLCPPAYPEDIIENLIYRYEEPNGMTRWDSPLFTVPYMDDKPDFDAIWEACLGAGVVVKPNQATVVKPPSESNYLYELDKTTQEVVTHIIDAQKNGTIGGQLKVPDCNTAVELPPNTVNLPQLQRIRRQYISLNRQHTQAKSRIRELFVNYLNQNLN
ncbi:chromatin associated protein KTI12 [Peziza echinospora]|nr:chromatin associated protein KTI12 [Peziza echinospora]